jgi:hypothetical protein
MIRRGTAIGKMLVVPAEAGIQGLKSLDYEIHPCISSCGPAIGCSNLLQADLVRLKTCRDDDYVGQQWVRVQLLLI